MYFIASIIPCLIVLTLLAIALRMGILIHNSIVGRRSPNQVTQPPISYAFVIAFTSLVIGGVVTVAFVVGVQYVFEVAGALAPTSHPLLVLIILLSALLLYFLATSVVTSFLLATTLMRAMSVSFYQWILMSIVVTAAAFATSGLWVGAELLDLNP
jgi:hypothetical protein